MGKDTGFLEIARARDSYSPVAERLRHYCEFAAHPDNTGTDMTASLYFSAANGAPLKSRGIPQTAK